MLFREEFWPGIKEGRIQLTFRRWRRPPVKVGSQLRSPVGLLQVDSVEVVDAGQITEEEALQAGYKTLSQLLVELNSLQGRLYRIAFHYVGPDPRLALREQSELSLVEFEELRARLARYESKAAWTAEALRLIQRLPGRRAAELADRLPMHRRAFKRRVRQLKELGLTESLGTGYRLSPRGQAYLARLAEAEGSSK